jgi:uridine phosphorylase
MMTRASHMSAQGVLQAVQFRPGDFGDIAIIAGNPQRAKMCADQMKDAVKNFTFLGYTFWTGTMNGKRITVGNGGFYAPDTAFATEILCAGGIKTLIRIGSCGAMDEKIQIGDFIVADRVIRGDGTTKYYVDDSFEAKVSPDWTAKLEAGFKLAGTVYKGGIWTTDAIFRETKDIVNSYIKKGALAVDMVTSPFVTVANLYKVNVCAVCVASDNLITGEMGFTDFRYFDAEMKMIKTAFEIASK